MRTFTARVVVVCAAASAFVPLQRYNPRALTQRAAPRDDGVRSRKDWQAVGAAPAIIRAAKLCGAGGGPTRIQAAGYAAVAAWLAAAGHGPDDWRRRLEGLPRGRSSGDLEGRPRRPELAPA